MTAIDLDQLVLGSQLSEMERLPVWVKALCARHEIAEETRFAINLCLEEAVSNVIRHGYGNAAGLKVTVSFTEPRVGDYLFAVEDNAGGFNPLEQAPLPAVVEQGPDSLGGQGIRLMRGFATSLDYEELVGGNRLRIGFGVKGDRGRT